MASKRRAGRKLTWKESDAKYAARGAAWAVLNRNAAGAPDYAAKFVAVCRVLLDVGPRGAGRGSHNPICRAGGPVPSLEIDDAFRPAPDRTTILVPSPAGKVPAGKWIRVRWDGMDYGIHLLVDPDAWRILAFSLTDESSEGAARLSGMLGSTLTKYGVGGIPLPRAVGRIVDAAYG